MTRLTTISLIAGVLAGCATTPPNLTPEIQAAYDKPLVCKGKEQCDLFWQRASFYINGNSRFKIQTANENLIETFSPTGGDTSVGYNLSREPLGKDEFRIWVKVWCDNMFGCKPHVNEEIAKLKMYVGKN